MTSIERTAYPRFGRLLTASELDGLAPVAEEAEWARAVSRSDEHLLSLVVALKCFQRLGYFPRAGQMPPVVVERVRGCLGLSVATGWQPPDRTGRWQQQLVRERLGVVSDPERAVARGAGDPVRGGGEELSAGSDQRGVGCTRPGRA